jgi:hypothetical protein
LESGCDRAASRKQLKALDYVLDEIQEQVLACVCDNERRQLTRLVRKPLNAG